MMQEVFAGTLGVAALLCATTAGAAQISAWNTDNVDVPAVNPPDGVTGESVIYDRDPSDAGAVTNGKIVYTPPEGVLPGITVENGLYTFGPSSSAATGCIRASAPTTCDGPRQSGKRFKQVATGFGPIDLSFDVDPNLSQDSAGDVDVGYRVFHRLINQTGKSAGGFDITLGYGVGDAFTASDAGDGLRFSTDIAFGQEAVSSFSQFPFGLFGDAETNPNFDLDGFFDGTSRAGFDVAQTEDTISSTGFYGAYESLFGNWLNQEDVPDGALWDNDGDDSTDALVMAWFDEAIDMWEIRRGIDPLDPMNALSLASSVFVSEFADVEDYLGLTGSDALAQDLIEDLANLNVNFGVVLDETFAGSQFTLRVQMDRVTPVPLPAALPLLLAGIGGLGLFRVRRRQ